MKAPSVKREPSLTPGKSGWLLALAVAALLHLAVAALAFWAPPTEPRGQAKAAGTGGVEIALGPAGSAAGGPKEQQGEDTPEPVTAPEPESVEPEPKPEPVKDPEPEKKQPPRPDRPIEPVKKVEPVEKPVPNPRPEPKPSPVKEAAPPPQASTAGAEGKSGTTEQNNTGSGDNTAGGGLPGETRDYAATLLAWLERHKEYPRRARLRRQQGTVLLYFVVDRQGRVLDYRIEQSAGYPVLDEEVQKMIERAQPLPAMPDTMNNTTLELVVPVQFFLR